MFRIKSTIGFLVLASVSSAATLVAQVPDRGIVEVGSASTSSTLQRGGPYITLGFGDGRESYRYSDEPNFTPTLSKPTFTFRMGGTPSARTRLGGEVFAWGNSINGGYESFTTFMMTGQWYPGKKGGLSFRGGAGFARSGTSYDDGGSVFESGFGYAVGVGLDLRAGRNFFITPTFDWYNASFAKRNEPTITERVMNIGIQLTLQRGGKR